MPVAVCVPPIPLLPTRWTIQLQKSHFRDFPGSPVVKTLHFHFKGMCSIPGQGINIPTCCMGVAKKKKKKTKKTKNKKKPKKLILAFSFSDTFGTNYCILCSLERLQTGDLHSETLLGHYLRVNTWEATKNQNLSEEQTGLQCKCKRAFAYSWGSPPLEWAL